jgi:hypothetical protein
MADLDTVRRQNAANEEARQLGYRLAVEPINRTTYAAVAYSLDTSEAPEGERLCGAASSLAALEEGVRILRER